MAYAYIAKFLNSHDRMPPVKKQDVGIAYTQYALDILASNIDDFPVTRKFIGGYSATDIATAQKWSETNLHKLQQ